MIRDVGRISHPHQGPALEYLFKAVVAASWQLSLVEYSPCGLNFDTVGYLTTLHNGIPWLLCVLAVLLSWTSTTIGSNG